ncbi:MAG TPA: hypothetical protein VFJ16_14930 [Longimicrobium sp.]|nr:hypothetical protein [Longimicrobium sp.]
MIGRFFRWIGNGRAAGKLRHRAGKTADAAERAELLLAAARLDDTAGGYLEAAVALAQAGRLDESAGSWRRAIDLKPLLIPSEAQLAALAPVLPQVARDVLDALSSHDRKRLGEHWKLERRGSFDGEERFRLEQERHDSLNDLFPTLRYLALAVAHTTGAPGRLRIDCDRLNPDSEAYNPIVQMGEAIVTWDAGRRITDARLQE